MVLACILLGCFHNFSLDPYYEPLPWLMICTYMYRLKHCHECYMENVVQKRVGERQIYGTNHSQVKHNMCVPRVCLYTYFCV